jgi:hypothetical protein
MTNYDNIAGDGDTTLFESSVINNNARDNSAKR